MTVYIRNPPSQSPDVYHTSPDCHFPRLYPDYEAVSEPPEGYKPCQAFGPCRRMDADDVRPFSNRHAPARPVPQARAERVQAIRASGTRLSLPDLDAALSR